LYINTESAYGCAQDPRLHYGVKLHFGNLDVDLDNPSTCNGLGMTPLDQRRRHTAMLFCVEAGRSGHEYPCASLLPIVVLQQ